MSDSSATRVERLDVLIVNWHGNLRGKRLPVSARKKILRGEARMPLSTQAQDIWGEDQDNLTGLGLSQGDPDGLCVPDDNMFHVQPWNAGHEQILTTLYTLDMQPSEFDVRAILERQVSRFKQLGLHPVVAVELEFYLLDASTRATGEPTIPEQLIVAGEPNDLQLYDMRTMDRAQEVLGRIHEYADMMCIPAETALAEFGPGQFEINLKHRNNPLRAADDAVLFKQLVDRAAQDTGLMATFMAKPYTEHGGSGQHVHVSVLDDAGNNVFDAGDGEPTLLLRSVAGCLDMLEETQLLLAPNGNSYRRLQPSGFAPARCDWGFDHRGVAIRLPETNGPAARIEHRVAGADANPYLVLVSVLGGILEGLEKAEATTTPPLLAGEEPAARHLTHDWLTAIERFEKSPRIHALLGGRFATLYARVKRHEAQVFNGRVSDVDLDIYLSRV